MLVLRTSRSGGRSFNGFQWPESGPVEAPDWDPEPRCGHGLHGLAEGRGEWWMLDWAPDAVWQVVEVNDASVVDLGDKIKFPRGNVIYSGDRDGAFKLLAGDKDVREWVCEDPSRAYGYALYVDKEPRDDTRAAACVGPKWAYAYADNMDEKPRDYTRAAACLDPEWAYTYALNVDEKPRDDTRAAACGDPEWENAYNVKLHGKH